MPIERRDLIGRELFTDIRTRQPLLAEKAFDITDLCPKEKPDRLTILAYANDECGELAFILEQVPPGEDLGWQGGMHFHVGFLSGGFESRPDIGRVFTFYAGKLGIHPELLAEVILTHAVDRGFAPFSERPGWPIY